MALRILAPVQDTDDDDSKRGADIEDDVALKPGGTHALTQILAPRPRGWPARELAEPLFEPVEIGKSLPASPMLGRVVGDRLEVASCGARELESRH